MRGNEYDKVLGAEIRRRRVAAGWTQEQLAAAMGLRQYILSCIEDGRRPMLVREFKAAIEAFSGPLPQVEDFTLAEQRAASRLGVEPATLRQMVYDKWGARLDEVRERRLPVHYSGEHRAALGHVTRRLLDELRQEDAIV